MKLECYKVNQYTAEITPGRGRRDWMDATRERFAYRCLPLSIANSSGWDLRCPAPVTIEWTGGQGPDAVKISGGDADTPVNMFAQSHFGEGVATFIPGYLFRTPPGIALWVSGPPNKPKDGIYALTGLVETDWLPFPFTMNWQMTRPGKVHFEKDESFAFITVMEQASVEQFQPEIRNLWDNKALADEFQAWTRARTEFNESLAGAEDMREVWQSLYVRGETPTRSKAPESHRTKRRLKQPRET